MAEDEYLCSWKGLVTESVMVQKKAARIMYVLQDEGSGVLKLEDANRICGLLKNVNSILSAVIRDIDRSRFREDI